MAVVITDSNFEELVLKANQPALIDFWAEWCAPCRMIAPFVEQIATEYDGRAIVGKGSVDQCPEITEKYGIRNIPTLLYFKGGEVVDKLVGATNKAVMANKLEDLL